MDRSANDERDVLRRLYLTGVVPVLTLTRPEDAVPVCRALLEGGIPAAEVTYRTDAAKEAIRRLRQELPDFLTGAGSILTESYADSALEAGAQFLVSPGFSEKVIIKARESGIPVVPGCSSATDLIRASEMGLSSVKFFPVEPLGGLTMLKALSAPFPELTFMPTGGLTIHNFLSYLDYPRVFACGGSWLAQESWIREARWMKITEAAYTTQEAVLRLSAQTEEGEWFPASPRILSSFPDREQRVTSAFPDIAQAALLAFGFTLTRETDDAWHDEKDGSSFALMKTPERKPT